MAIGQRKVSLMSSAADARFNWTDQPADRSFEVGAAESCTDFWTGQDLGRQTGMLKLPPLPPRSARTIVCE